MLNPPYPGIPQRTNTNEVFERVFDKVMTDTYGFAPERNEDGTLDEEVVKEQFAAQQTLEMAELDEEEAVDREIRLAQLIPPPKPKKEPTYTKQGTPCSPKWDEEWIEQVEKTEDELGHRCCGARINEIFPCELEASRNYKKSPTPCTPSSSASEKTFTCSKS